MPNLSPEPQLVRFGEFALDLRSGELSKNGSRLLLPLQPFQILALLVRSPGTLVTRDDLRRELWREDTFVDFEHCLNAAIKRLRQALRDSAATPRFIETLPRRGYRFKAVVDAGSAIAPKAADGPINEPYALLARYYDGLCAYAAPMNRHARSRILRTVLPRVRSVCDLGCGSGETAIELARRGFEVYAVDSSPVFCGVVRARAHRAKLRVAVQCDDMRDFTLPRPVDLVLAEFDVNTPLSLRTQYPQTYWIEHKKFKLVQHGSLEADGQRARLDFEWLIPSGRMWRHVRETLWHVCWTDAEIRRALRLAGFELLRCFDGQDVRPKMAGEKRGTDAYYLARKRKTVNDARR